MHIELIVDKDQLANFLWIMLAMKGIVNVICGLSGEPIKRAENYGGPHIIAGLFWLVAAWWVLA